jgi:transcriptional regulator with XRE-family HTH domain/alkyl hydroperoxide reductase subunit AhpC
MAEPNEAPEKTRLESFAEDLLADEEAREEYERNRLAIDVGRRIRAAREARELSQSDLAARTGMSQSAIARLELGGRTASLPTLARLVKALEPADQWRDIDPARLVMTYAEDAPETVRSPVRSLLERISTLLSGSAERLSSLPDALRTPGVRVGDLAPDVTAETPSGAIKLYDYLGDDWGVVLTRSGEPSSQVAQATRALRVHVGDFAKRHTKLVVVADNVEVGDVVTTMKPGPTRFLLVMTGRRRFVHRYGGESPWVKEGIENVVVIGPDKRVKLTMTRPAGTAWRVDDVLEAVDLAQGAGPAPRVSPPRSK